MAVAASAWSRVEEDAEVLTRPKELQACCGMEPSIREMEGGVRTERESVGR